MEKQKVYNRVYNKERWEQVSSYNKQILEDYMLQIKSEKKSIDTQKQYYNDCRIILIYIMLQLDNKPLYKLTRKSFRNFTLWMQDNGMSSSRINRMLTCCRNMLNFCMDDDEYEDDFVESKANPNKIKGLQKEKVRDIIFLTDEEIHIIIKEFIKKKEYQKALLFALGYDSGSRRKELWQLGRYDISLESNICKTQVRGKRGKMYRPIYHQLTKDVYKLYEKSRVDDTDYLWITVDEQGKVSKASYETLYNWVISARVILQKATGEFKEFTPHSLRHSLAQNTKDGTHYLCKKTGALDLTVIQKLLNHSDASTTQGYLKDTTEDELLSIFM